MFQRLNRTAALVVAAVGLSVALAACGSSDGSGNSASGTSASTKDGVDEAKAEVAKYTHPADFEAEPLTKTPPTGKLVAQVLCSLPSCTLSGMPEATAALGWKLQQFQFDVGKGPQDFTRAFDLALDAKPDYIAVVMIYPPDIVSKQLERAKAEGIPVIAGGTDHTDPFALTVLSDTTNNKTGAIAADAILADAGGATKVMTPVDPNVTSHTLITDGVTAELEKLSPESTSDVLELSLAQPAETNVAGIVNYLKANPDTKYVIFLGSSFYGGVHQALQAAGLLDKVKLLITFPQVPAIPSIQDGEFFASVANEGLWAWRQADAMARLSVGDKIADATPAGDFRIMTPDNASVEGIDPPNYTNGWLAAWGVK